MMGLGPFPVEGEAGSLIIFVHLVQRNGTVQDIVCSSRLFVTGGLSERIRTRAGEGRGHHLRRVGFTQSVSSRPNSCSTLHETVVARRTPGEFGYADDP